MSWIGEARIWLSQKFIFIDMLTIKKKRKNAEIEIGIPFDPDFGAASQLAEEGQSFQCSECKAGPSLAAFQSTGRSCKQLISWSFKEEINTKDNKSSKGLFRKTGVIKRTTFNW